MSETITYVTAPEAVQQITERLADTALTSEVLRFLGGELPDARLLTGKPAFIFGDYVARGRGLDVAYARETIAAGGEPYWAMYDDAYSRTNPAKASIVRPLIQLPNGVLIDDRRITSGDDQLGGMMSRRTIFGNTLAEYHGMLRDAVFIRNDLQAVLPNAFDIGPWYRTQARRFGYQDGDRLAASYMLPRTALGIIAAQSVTYEQRHYDSGFMDLVLPAIERVRAEFGVEPIFVRRPTPPLDDIISLRGIAEERVVLDVVGKGKRQQVAVKEVTPEVGSR